ncbi:putative lipoprotein [Candidatus Neoehrlichia lotoris str. RAC413]|uniref:Putative lipoprotein n=1 Tax=Candidatus Neoehrlichia procyonis str. RAC413 TaxID=1359163 RepID=A0A0F3NLU5_9RICK|nr:putative lipoprotein [Candidatus Neoehrlichia lotoris str. RAC413]
MAFVKKRNCMNVALLLVMSLSTNCKIYKAQKKGGFVTDLYIN